MPCALDIMNLHTIVETNDQVIRTMSKTRTRKTERERMMPVIQNDLVAFLQFQVFGIASLIVGIEFMGEGWIRTSALVG